jgi:hypothetical protein
MYIHLKKIFLPVHNPDQPEPKRLFLTTETQRTQSFFIKISSLGSLCLCGEKIFCQIMARFHNKVTVSLIRCRGE